MAIVAVSHDDLKAPLVSALFDSTELADYIGLDSNGNKSIYEGWHVPERTTIKYPYLTYRINWYATIPTGFINGTMTIDAWDTAPMGNDASRIENICTILTLIFDGNSLMKDLIFVRCWLASDEWIEEEEPNHIHRQVTINLRTIDSYLE